MPKTSSRVGKKTSKKGKTRRSQKSKSLRKKQRGDKQRGDKQRGGSSDFQRPGAGLAVEKEAVVSMRLPSDDSDAPGEYHLISAQDAEKLIEDERP